MKKYITTAMILVVLGFAISVSSPTEVSARIKLATLPVRDRVEIQMDNIRATLVEEERIVPLLKSNAKNGNNMIDFSWSSTRIDKSSILFRTIAIRKGGEFEPVKKVQVEGGKTIDEVSVVNVSYPPNENALVWEVYAKEACAAKVRVSYLISQLSRSFSYRALASKDEKSAIITNYMTLRNKSGESFEDSGIWAGFGERFKKDLMHNYDVKVLMHKFKQVKVEKIFNFDWYRHGKLNEDKPFASRILMYYRMNNTQEGGMGLFPIQPGKVRMFIEDGHGGEAFLGEDLAKLIPIDDKLDLFLGDSRDIVCTRKIELNERSAIRGKRLFNQEIIIKYEIENFKKEACKLRILEQLNRVAREYFGNTHGDVEWKQGSRTTEGIEFSYEQGGTNPILIVDLPPAPEDPNAAVEKKIVQFHFVIENLWQ